jgi:ATP-binding protein involved in chromosome partitioning
MGADVKDQILQALGRVKDPELHKPLTQLGMVGDVAIYGGRANVAIKLTIATCPMQDRLEADIQRELLSITEVNEVVITFSVMSDDEREEMKKSLRGGVVKVNPFTLSTSLTRVIAVASGKGGVGKSSVTANLAVAAANRGLSVGILDADVYGHSIPRLLGITGEKPTAIDKTFFVPVEKFGVKVVSMEMFKPKATDHIAYRGPLLHRVLDQLMCDAYWGTLDILFLDLPPGTGDIAISLGQMLPQSEVIVVTTPQLAASEVAERAGRMAHQMNQRILGVVENMSDSPCPHCGQGIALFGSGGGELTAKNLSELVGEKVELLAKIPFDTRLRNGGDEGTPVTSMAATAAESEHLPIWSAFDELLENILVRRRSLAGKNLGLKP